MLTIDDPLWRKLDATIYVVRTDGDPLRGRCEFVSGGPFHMLGYDPQEFKTNPELWNQLLHPEDVPGVIQSTIQMFQLGQPSTRVYRMKDRKTGTYHWIEDSSVPLTDDLGQLSGIAGVARDITPLKRVQEALQGQRDELESLIDALPDGVMVTNQQGLIEQVKPGLTRILGWKPEELEGRRVETLVPERLRGEHSKLRARYSREPNIRHKGTRDLVALHRNGTEVPVDIMLSPLPSAPEPRFLVIVRDMSEARATQRQVAMLSALVRSSGDCIVASDINGLIESWNRGAEQLFGFEEREVLGKHVTMLYPLEYYAECMGAMERIRKGEYPLQYETRRLRKSGEEFDASVTVSPILDEEGQLVGISSITRDISERKMQQAEVRVAKRAAELASQAKSEFLANISHELRTPLNEIIGLGEALLDSELHGEQREHVTVAIESAEALLATINGIMELADLQRGRYLPESKRFKLGDLVPGTLDLCRLAAAKKHLNLSCEIHQGLPGAFVGDEQSIRHILLELVKNAIKNSPSGGVHVRILSGAEPDVVCFEVRDSGVSIPATEQALLFQPFSRGGESPRRQLGLAICAELADLLGGRISVESDGYSGNTFRFSVPLEAAETDS